MNISKTSWHYKLFRLNYILKASLFNKSYDDWYWQDFSNRPVNLCHYMRTILVWLPLKLLTYVGFYAILLWLIFEFGVKTYGGGFLLMLMAIAGLAVIGGAFFVFFLLEGFLKKQAQKVREEKEDHKKFTSLLFEWYRAAKEKVCPIMEVK